MSYQLEREMLDRVSRYQTEAAMYRAVPHRGLRHKLATTLRAMADRLEDREMEARLAAEQSKVALQGRNH